MSEKYQVMLKCKNCGNQNWIMGIQKGTSVEAHCLNHESFCEKCECAFYQEKEEDKEKKK